MRERLFESLKTYSNSGFYPFHMPGHKRNPESGPLAAFYQYDITEIDGFDNLHQPESLIKAFEREIFSGKWKYGRSFECSLSSGRTGQEANYFQELS